MNFIKTTFDTMLGIYENPDNYHRWALQNGRTRKAEEVLNIINQKKTLFPETRILDVAGGTGIISKTLIQAGYRVTTTDINPNLLEYGREQGYILDPVIADMNEGLPFSNSSFDVITLFGARRYFTSKGFDIFIEESLRVLSNEGMLIFNFSLEETPQVILNQGVEYTFMQTYLKYLSNKGFNTEIQKVWPRSMYIVAQKIS